MIQPSNPNRTTQAHPKSDALIRVQYKHHESWSAPADGRHRVVVLLAPECAGTLTWDMPSKRGSADSALAKQAWAQVPAQVLASPILSKPMRMEGGAVGDASSKRNGGKRAAAGAAMETVRAVETLKQRHVLTGQQVFFIEKQTPATLCFEERTPVLVVSFTDKFLADFAPDFTWRGVLLKSCFDALKTDMRIGALLEFLRELHQGRPPQGELGGELGAQREGVASPSAGYRFHPAPHPHYVHALGVMLAVHLLCASRPKRPGEAAAGLTPAQLRKAQDYIDAHFKETIRISALYRAVGLGRKIFGQRFKATTGMVPRQYILTRKVAYAQGLLQKGQLLRAEIAAAAGFADQSHMGRCLRRFCSRPPSPISPRKGPRKPCCAKTFFAFAGESI